MLSRQGRILYLKGILFVEICRYEDMLFEGGKVELECEQKKRFRL